jgi:RNA polymerase sigma-70 factor (ECF subfamily)
MLLHDSRRAARTDAEGGLVVLEHQDRSRWDTAEISEGLGRLDTIPEGGPAGYYRTQAAIAAVHARAPDYAATDWSEIVARYDQLLSVAPTPVVRLNQAVAVAMNAGPVQGLELIDLISSEGSLDDYHLLHTARGAMLERMGRNDEAVAAYRAALARVRNQKERRHLESRLAELGVPPDREVEDTTNVNQS